MSRSIVLAAIVVIAASVPALTATSSKPQQDAAPPTTASLEAKSAWFSQEVGKFLDGVPSQRDGAASSQKNDR